MNIVSNSLSWLDGNCCSGRIAIPVDILRYSLHSSQMCTQYFVSSCVFVGMPFFLAQTISSVVFGGAKRPAVCGGWCGRGCSVGGAGRAGCICCSCVLVGVWTLGGALDAWWCGRCAVSIRTCRWPQVGVSRVCHQSY